MFSIIDMIRIRFFGPGELIQKGVRAARYAGYDQSACPQSPCLVSMTNFVTHRIGLPARTLKALQERVISRLGQPRRQLRSHWSSSASWSRARSRIRPHLLRCVSVWQLLLVLSGLLRYDDAAHVAPASVQLREEGLQPRD